MNRGLVIGRFMPLHKGHVALIRFAAQHCDELIVSMTFKPGDEIPGPMRFEWIKEEFAHDKNIWPEISIDDFDDESMPVVKRIPIWTEFLKGRLPSIDSVFSSEEYGPALAASLGARHIAFDPERKAFPISAKVIREAPMKNWDLISDPAKPWFVKKICFFGPESTGKSILAEQLASDYQTEFVPEVAREIVSSNSFTAEDIIRIGYAQTDRVLEKTRTAKRYLFCDTDLITTQIYSRHYLHTVPPVLAELEKRIAYDRYFLFDIDVPWVADGLRDLGERRKEMFDVFKSELEKRGIPYILVRGSFEERKKIVVEEIEKFA